ncbi:MAG: hypothetical protein ABI594_05545 [Ginsengibacter sp.]
MGKGIFTTSFLFFFIIQTNAQLGVMKLVGNGTKNYKLGFGAFIKAAFPVSDASNVTIEIGADFFPSKDGGGDGTAMCPLKAGYRYTLNGTGEGFYVEPQVGYNVYGSTSLQDENGNDIDLKYHGVVLAAGGGYLFSIGNVPIDINLRYETVIAHGGSNNLVSLGITKSFSFGRRDKD